MNKNVKLSLNTVDYPFETLVQRANLKPPKLILDPDFQRKYKWDKEGWSRASKFIESCLMRIPLPSCYFAETTGGAHLVIDGVQRITTVIRYFNDEFELEELSAFPELNGKKFSEIGEYQSDLESTTIRCIILRSENPKEIITEIFARLNQGAVSLSDQEIRHALFSGDFDALLRELAQSRVIARFGLGKSGTSKRDARESEELVLRYFAFMEDAENYEGSLAKFLDSYMARASQYNPEKLEELKRKFNNSLSACLEIFDEDEVFSDIGSSRRRQGVVYYDLLMNTLGGIERATLVQNRERIRAAFVALCKSTAFSRLTAGGLQRKSSITQRNKAWNDRLQKALKNGPVSH